MRRWGVALVGAVALSACGGSSHKTATRSNLTGTTATSSAPAKPPPGIAGRVLTNNELPGFTGQPPTPDTSISQWELDTQVPSAQQPADKRRLRREGFLQGVSENLSDGGTPGLSVVEQFRTAQGARSENAFGLVQFKHAIATQGKYTEFAVPGIPGALGYGVLGGGGGGINVSFAKGPYAYTVGEVLGAQGSVKTSIADLVAAARHLYRRISA